MYVITENIVCTSKLIFYCSCHHVHTFYLNNMNMSFVEQMFV